MFVVQVLAFLMLVAGIVALGLGAVVVSPNSTKVVKYLSGYGSFASYTVAIALKLALGV
jgi:hypothetical protein